MWNDIIKEVEEKHDYSFSDYLHYIYMENHDKFVAIENYIKTCDESVYDKAKYVFEEYFGLTVPTEIIRKVFLHDMTLAFENACGGMTDTCVRDDLADALMGLLLVPRWPINCDSEEYKTAFCKELHKQCEKHGIVCHWVEKV